MEVARVNWTPDKKRQLQALGFNYNEADDKWVKCNKDHDEFIRATTEYLYWFDTEAHNGGKVRGHNMFPIMDFEALIIFLRAVEYIEDAKEKGIRK